VNSTRRKTALLTQQTKALELQQREIESAAARRAKEDDDRRRAQAKHVYVRDVGASVQLFEELPRVHVSPSLHNFRQQAIHEISWR
jgi:hypothetical protein